jgi:mono/diheme cytochrome c family protein
MPRTASLAALGALAASALWLGTSSCSYQNEEELFGPPQSTCDTLSVTYSGTIAPLMAQNCQRCHGPTRRESGVVVTSHHDVQTLGRTGQLLGTITHRAGYPAMPQDGPKLSDCDINKVRIWVRAGMPDN